MIIICKECSTKFKLDESLLQETGSQVRCCNCKNIFTVYPPQALGKTETAQSQPSQQGYFDSEESIGGGPAGFTQSDEEPDDDGIELDVDEDDEDFEDAGLDLGDDDTGFDDGGIDMGGGGGMPGMDSGMDSGINFDEDMDTEGVSDLGLDTGSDTGLEEMDLDSDLSLEQDDEIDFDSDSSAPDDFDSSQDLDEAPDMELESEPPAEDFSDDDMDDDFEFEFELDEDEKPALEEELTLDEPSLEDDLVLEEEDATPVPAPPEPEPEPEPENEIEVPAEEDFELSLEEGILEEGLEGEDDGDFSDLMEEADELEKSSQDKTMSFDLDSADLGDEEEDEYEIEEVDEFEEDDEEYDIEEYEDDDQEFEDDDMFDDEYVDEGSEDSAKPKKKRKKPSRIFQLLIILLFICAIGGGAFLVTDGFTKKFDFSKINFSVFKNITNIFNSSKINEVPEWASINNQSLNGRYVNNENVGKLFIITGKITNDSTIPLNHVEVEGTLIAKGGVVAKKKKVFCGNIITEGDLSTLSVNAINRKLERKAGEQNSNINIKAGEAVPFMLVFSGLPEELENYTVSITSFDRIKTK